jgi:hypothetical protein
MKVMANTSADLIKQVEERIMQAANKASRSLNIGYLAFPDTEHNKKVKKKENRKKYKRDIILAKYRKYMKKYSKPEKPDYRFVEDI